ncbi:MAG: carbon-nitrogen hydrolase family protein [Pseudomonadota bacterium]
MTARSFTAALVQCCSGRNIEENIEVVSSLVREAARQGANFVSTPEMTHLLETSAERLSEAASYQVDDPGVSRFSALAAELGLWLNIGSLAIRLRNGRYANRSFLFAPDGAIKASYDKIHMFDVELGGGESYLESKRYEPGERAVMAALPWAKLGMTICYDMRFPALFRTLAQAGAGVLTVPSAFTVPTGKAHWHTLLRARAIDAGAYVLAAAQSGEHECGRKTYGHSLVVSPCGEILADGGEEIGVVLAEIDPSEIEAARRRVPAFSLNPGWKAPREALEQRAVS